MSAQPASAGRRWIGPRRRHCLRGRQLATVTAQHRDIVAEIARQPNLPHALLPKDLVARYGVSPYAAGRLLQRARNLHVKHGLSAGEGARCGR